MLGLAWAPLLWLPAAPRQGMARARLWQAAAGVMLVALLTVLAGLVHVVPLGVHDAPNPLAGLLALAGIAALYLCLAILQWRPRALSAWRHWAYAGFYVDEFYTRLALRLWPVAGPSRPHMLRPPG